jgi:hypothetical protein
MIRRWSPVVGALLALLVAGIAQAQSTPPHRFFGTITIDGQSAMAGTIVSAYIGSTECGTYTVVVPGRYQIDVLPFSLKMGCARGGEAISFRTGDRTAMQMPTFRTGGFEELNLTFGPGGPVPTATPPVVPTVPPPPTGFNAAVLNLSDPRPCVPEAGQRTCDATRNALWNGEAAAWAARGVTDPDARFNETVVFRIRANDPAVIAIIARFLGAPFLQVTYIKFRGSEAGQTDEFVEITNLGGGPQDMTGWIVRSPATNQVYNFPAGFVMAGGQVCRVYTGAPRDDSCGGTSFNRTNVWPDDMGEVVLFYEALALPGANPLYSADPNNQPPPPNLVGVNAQ